MSIPPFDRLSFVGKTDERKETRDFLLRGLPRDVAEKLKVAASLHGTSMRSYVQEILEAHLKELERKGIKLSLPRR